MREEEAIFHVASLLKDDRRVNDWNVFYASLNSKNSRIAEEPGFEICIPHARTSAVKEMVMSVGRSMPASSPVGATAKTQYIFVIGLPAALAADYLRVIGAIARVFKDARVEAQLRSAAQPEEFLAILASGEMSF